jgi:2'-5' RNA ligase
VTSAELLLAYWLIPAEPALRHFASLITELATRFDAPVFEPHLTLYATRAADEKPAEVIETAFAHLGPPPLLIAGVRSSDEFTKTLFVQFHPDAALKKFSEKLQATSRARRDYELNPHLSLLYKDMDTEAKLRLAVSIALPFTEVIFDSVKAVICPATISSGKDIEAWRVVAERKLTG